MLKRSRLIRRSELKSKSRIKPSRGTVVPEWMKNYVFTRDEGCLGPRLGFPGECWGPLDPDHVRSSLGMGMKSPTEVWNLACLCRLHHSWKEEHPLEARPKLLDWLDKVQPESVA